MNRKNHALAKRSARGGGAQIAPSARAPRKLIFDLRKLIDESRHAVAQTVNSALVWLYWNIGRRIRDDVLKHKRAGYGEQIFYAVSRQLIDEYGQGFGRQNLFRMTRFAEVFPNREIVSSLMRQLYFTRPANAAM